MQLLIPTIMFFIGVGIGFFVRPLFDTYVLKETDTDPNIKLETYMKVSVAFIVLILYVFVVQNSLAVGTPIPVEVTGLVGAIVGFLFSKPLTSKK